MVRRIANQVHQQAARLMRSDYIKHEPAWYRAVLDHPPLPLPPRAPPARPHNDGPRPGTIQEPRDARPRTPRPLPVYYLEDDVRRQFFRDHPFEAFRERSLVEEGVVEDEHPIRGKAWIRLSQRGKNPTPEDTVRFAVNLHVEHAAPLSKAYAAAVAQFRALRSEAQLANTVGALEAEFYGAQFAPGETERQFAAEARALASWDRTDALDQGALAARKRWRAIVERRGLGSGGEFSGGREYARLWKEGVRPNYAPALTEPVGSAPLGATTGAPASTSFEYFGTGAPSQRR